LRGQKRVQMRKIKSVCIYCGSNTGKREEYSRVAARVGRLLAANGITLVYGGGNVGLMGIAATAALEGGGRVIGIIPEILVDRELAHLEVTELKVVTTMHERKALMESLSDTFIALPGGFGTYDELFEIITWAQIGFHSKPVGLLNVNGYYDKLIQFIDGAVDEEFIKPVHRSLLQVNNDPVALLRGLGATLDVTNV
jgi:uncharacterized protein (TIGR00730 family)